MVSSIYRCYRAFFTTSENNITSPSPIIFLFFLFTNTIHFPRENVITKREERVLFTYPPQRCTTDVHFSIIRAFFHRWDSSKRDNQEVLDLLLQQAELGGTPENQASSIMHARTERNRPVRAYRPIVDRSMRHSVTKLPDHRVQISRAFSHLGTRDRDTYT